MLVVDQWLYGALFVEQSCWLVGVRAKKPNGEKSAWGMPLELGRPKSQNERCKWF